MTFFSLPKYPTPISSLVPRGREKAPLPTRRATRIVFDLAMLAVIAVVLYQMRQLTAAIQGPPTPPPLDFELVAKRYDKVRLLTRREEVETLLGPPTKRGAPGPDLQDEERMAEQAHRHVGIRGQRFWCWWSDPKDEGRWVAVLYAGTYGEYKSYWIVKKGF